MLKSAVFAALAVACLLSPAHACVPTSDVMRPCAYEPNFLAGVKSISVTMHREHHAPSLRQLRLTRDERASLMIYKGPGNVIQHPTGCPWRAFCGCGAAVRVFGHSVRNLWLAANWLHFPRAAPAPGMAAVKRHHVFVLEQHISGDTWLAYDANSGGHATRLHPRSIAGYVIVDPRA